MSKSSGVGYAFPFGDRRSPKCWVRAGRVVAWCPWALVVMFVGVPGGWCCVGVVVWVEDRAVGGPYGSLGWWWWWWWWWWAACLSMWDGGGLFASVYVVDCGEGLCGWVKSCG